MSHDLGGRLRLCGHGRYRAWSGFRQGPASSSERFYFKASPTFFSNEATVTAAVADRFPEISPRLVAVDRTRGWMLMEDLGDLTLGAADSADLWREAMRALARVQIEYANDPDTLESWGLERRRTSAISGTLRQWVQNSRELGLHYASQRAQSALGRLEPHLDLADQLYRKVESAGLPQTLDHGDLDAGNMFVREGTPVIMDWSDASISNPLFAPALIPQVARDSSLADAFLAEWSEFVAMDRLQEAYEAAGPIAALERAFHYHRNIVAQLGVSVGRSAGTGGIHTGPVESRCLRLRETSPEVCECQPFPSPSECGRTRVRVNWWNPSYGYATVTVHGRDD